MSGHSDCGGSCAATTPCASCGGRQDPNSPSRQALAWGLQEFGERPELSPFWRAAGIADTVRGAPARSTALEWVAMDSMLGLTQDIVNARGSGPGAPMWESGGLRFDGRTSTPIIDRPSPFDPFIPDEFATNSNVYRARGPGYTYDPAGRGVYINPATGVAEPRPPRRRREPDTPGMMGSEDDPPLEPAPPPKPLPPPPPPPVPLPRQRRRWPPPESIPDSPPRADTQPSARIGTTELDTTCCCVPLSVIVSVVDNSNWLYYKWGVKIVLSWSFIKRYVVKGTNRTPNGDPAPNQGCRLEWWEKTNQPAGTMSTPIVDSSGLPQQMKGVWSQVAYFRPASPEDSQTTGQGFAFDDFMSATRKMCSPNGVVVTSELTLHDDPQEPRLLPTFVANYTDIRWRLVGGCETNDIQEGGFQSGTKWWLSDEKFPDTGEPPPYWTYDPLDGQLHEGSRYER